LAALSQADFLSAKDAKNAKEGEGKRRAGRGVPNRHAARDDLALFASFADQAFSVACDAIGVGAA
jgi:hypothetical protein